MALSSIRLTDGVVTLRPPEPDDIDAVFAACQDPTIARFTAIPSPYQRAHAADWVGSAPRAWRTEAAAPFVIVDAGSDALIGSVGLVEICADRSSAEVGYWVLEQARCRGVAPAAVRLVARWVLCDLGFARLELQADVRNHPSHRVAEKAGFRREGEVPAPVRFRARLERVVMFALTREELPADQLAAPATG